MSEEMKVLQKNDTWEIDERQEEKKSVGCRWIYVVIINHSTPLIVTRQNYM